MKDIKFKKLIFIILLSITFIIFKDNVLAAGGTFQLANMFNRTKVLSGLENYIPTSAEYPFNTSSATQIGFDKLYGTEKRLITYYGEIPYTLKDEDAFLNYRYFNGDSIDGKSRNYNLGSSDITEDNDDIRLQAMTVSHDELVSVDLVYIILLVLFNKLPQVILTVLFTIKNFDFGEIIGQYDSKLVEMLRKIFLFNGNRLSPFLVFGVGLFMVSLVCASIKIIKGTDEKRSWRYVLNEFGFFTLAAIVSSIFLTTTNVTKFNSIGLNFITYLSNELVADASDGLAIFKTSAGSTTKDITETQSSFLNKILIDQLIYIQFGITVDDLEGSSWGTSEFTVSNGGASVSNLGYWFWAADSGVEISDRPFYSSGTGTWVKTASNERVLFLIDFLNSKRGDKTSEVNTIMQRFCTPNYTNSYLILILTFALYASLFVVLGICTLFSFSGEVIVILGGYFMVILPTLLLFNKTRIFAKKMCYSYIFGLVRYLVGTVLFNAILAVVVLLCESGYPGIILSIGLCVVLFTFSRKLLGELNEMLNRMARGKELNFMNNLNRKILPQRRWNESNHWFSKFSKSKSDPSYTSAYSHLNDVEKVNVDNEVESNEITVNESEARINARIDDIDKRMESNIEATNAIQQDLDALNDEKVDNEKNGKDTEEIKEETKSEEDAQYNESSGLTHTELAAYGDNGPTEAVAIDNSDNLPDTDLHESSNDEDDLLDRLSKDIEMKIETSYRNMQENKESLDNSEKELEKNIIREDLIESIDKAKDNGKDNGSLSREEDYKRRKSQSDAFAAQSSFNRTTVTNSVKDDLLNIKIQKDMQSILGKHNEELKKKDKDIRSIRGSISELKKQDDELRETQEIHTDILKHQQKINRNTNKININRQTIERNRSTEAEALKDMDRINLNLHGVPDNSNNGKKGDDD